MPPRIESNSPARQSSFSASVASTLRQNSAADGWDSVRQDSSQNETPALPNVQSPSRMQPLPSGTSSVPPRDDLDTLSQHAEMGEWLHASAPSEAHQDILLSLSLLTEPARRTLLAATAHPVEGWPQLLQICRTRGMGVEAVLGWLTLHANVEIVGQRITALQHFLAKYFDAQPNAGDGMVRLMCAGQLWTQAHRDESALKHSWTIMLDPELRDPAAFVRQFKKIDADIAATQSQARLGPTMAHSAAVPRPYGLTAQGMLHAAAALPRRFARAAILLGTGTAPQAVLETVESHFNLLRNAPTLVRAATHVETLEFLTRFDSETLRDLDQRLLGHNIASGEVLTVLRHYGVAATTDYAEHRNIDPVMDAPLALTVLAASLATSCGRHPLQHEELLAAATQITQPNADMTTRIRAMVQVLRTQPTYQHRRVWTGASAWTRWPRDRIVLAANLGCRVTAEALNIGLLAVSLEPLNREPMQTSLDRIVNRLGRNALLPEHQPFAALAPRTEEEPAPNLPPMRWNADENVMLQERRDVVDASVLTLLARHPLADIPSYQDYKFQGYSRNATSAARYIRDQEIPYQVGDQHLLLRDVLRVVLHVMHTHEHPSRDANKTRTDRQNMHTALDHNLDSAVTPPTEPGGPAGIVCFTGLVERMVRALHGYDAHVKVLFVTPQELANHVAADVQKTRTAALTDADADAFVDRCKAIAQDLYSGDATRVAEVEDSARKAIPYLQDRV